MHKDAPEHTKKRIQAEEHTVPWVAALTTYFGYAILMIFGAHSMPVSDGLDS
jgi:hypothetical protein